MLRESRLRVIRSRPIRNPALNLHRHRPAIANAAERFDGVVFVILDESASLGCERQYLEDAIARGNEVPAERAKLPVAERLVKLANECATTGTDVWHGLVASDPEG